MLAIAEKISVAKKIKNFLIFFIFFIAFFLYFQTVPLSNTFLSFFTYFLILLIFFFSLVKPKFGIYILIFFTPLLNSLTTILGVRPIPFLVLLPLSYFLGFLIYSLSELQIQFIKPYRYNYLFDTELGKTIIMLLILVIIGAAITIFRYINFYPFITNSFHNLKLDISGKYNSFDSIFWVISYLMNYLIGFLVLFGVFNSLRKFIDIKKALFIFVASTIISSIVIMYQYFFNPLLGSFRYWVESGRLNATFSDPNSLGAFIVLIFPIFVLMIIISKKLYLKIIFCLLTIPLFLMAAFSGSRTALLGIIIGSLLFIIFSIIIYFKKVKLFFIRKKILCIIIIILIVILAVSSVLLIAVESPVKESLNKIGLLKRTSDSIDAFFTYYKQAGFLEAIKSISNYRYIYWNQAVNMAKDYPVTGVGPGAYIIELGDYLYMHERTFTQLDFAGNFYLQILSELGFPGLILFLLIIFFLVKKFHKYFKLKKFDIEKKSLWITVSLFISFISMLAILILGPHTNFTEIQITFWILIGLMLASIKVEYINQEHLVLFNDKSRRNNKILTLDNRVSLGPVQVTSMVIIILIFTCSLILSSVTSLSIAAKQNNHNWSNEYGFYGQEKNNNINFRWTEKDASLVVERKGNFLIIPVQDGFPQDFKDTDYEPLKVNFFIDNLMVKEVKLTDDEWYNIKLSVPLFAAKRVTLTIVCNRSWSPNSIGLNKDSRELGIRLGDIIYE